MHHSVTSRAVAKRGKLCVFFLANLRGLTLNTESTGEKKDFFYAYALCLAQKEDKARGDVIMVSHKKGTAIISLIRVCRRISSIAVSLQSCEGCSEIGCVSKVHKRKLRIPHFPTG